MNQIRHIATFIALSLLLCWSTEILAEAPKSLMQCVSSCLQHEGDTADAKQTCKSRCANVSPNVGQSGNQTQPSCMSVYKKCNRSCGEDEKNCRRDCKEALMECR